MPANAQIVAVPDSISVSETGGAIQNFPIAVPPGTAGVVPSLSLTYNSQGQNGIVGMGFMLNGLATIGRCPRTFATEGVRGGSVNYDVNDRFCLDGQRLIAISGVYGADGTEYRTELESFSKVISHGSAGTGPAWFDVRTKSGQVMEFGNTADSRILATGRAEARSWAVNKVADTAGNYMTVSYVNDTANGQAFPSRIDYTGNSTAGLAPYNSVRFVYSTTRPDVVTTYLAGSLMRTTALLTNVQTYAGDSLISDYRLTYNSVPATNRMRLRTVTLCEGSGACLPATTVGWTSGGDLNAGFVRPVLTVSDSVPGDYLVYSSGDFNGDGLTDLYLAFAQSNRRGYGTQPGQVWLSKGDGTFDRRVLTVSDSVPNDYLVYSSGDFNGDGLTDLYLAFAQSGGRGYGTQPGQVWLSKGDGTFDRRILTASDSVPNNYLVYSSGDFNGDGLTDLYLANSQADGRGKGDQPGQVWLSKGDGTFNRLVLTVSDSVPADYRVFSSGDFNGDGLTDLYIERSEADGRAADGSQLGYVWLSKGDGTFDRITVPAAETMPDFYRVFASGDFNGDGLTDLYIERSEADGRAANGSQLGYVWLSKGDGTFDRITVPAAETMPDFYQVFASGDFNGDGLTDLYLAFAQSGGRGYGTQPGQVWLSKGDGTFDRRVLTVSDSVPNNYLLYSSGDFNGDGLTDLYLAFAQSDGRGYGTQPGQLWLTPGPPPDILALVTDGLGAQTSITYRPMTDGTIYTKDAGTNAATYPIVDVISSMLIASRIEQTDGVGGVRASTYRYTGAKADSTGRGFLGFREMTARDEQNGIEQKSAFEQLYPFTLMKKSETQLRNGSVLSNSVNTYSSADLGGTRRRVFLTQSTAAGADLNGAPLPSSTTTYQYDSYSNATAIAVTASDGFSKTTTNTYLNDTSNWLLGRLLTATVASQAPNVASQAPAPDTTPDAFDFTDVGGAAPGTAYEDSIFITGFNRVVTATVSGGQIRKNGAGDWVTSLTFNPGDKLNLRVTSAPAYGATVTATVSVGGISADWKVVNERVIVISSNVNDFNLRSAHDSLYPVPTGNEQPAPRVVAIVEPNVIVGSSSTAAPAFDVGSWPGGIPITVVVRGRIQGSGGKGADGAANAPLAGQDGGLAFYTRYPIGFILNDGAGAIWGGGGGGGGGDRDNSKNGKAGAGGGGAGQVPGNGGAGSAGASNAAPGTATTGGTASIGDFGRNGGNGGGPGLPGDHGGGTGSSAGGAAGTAIDGNSFITKTGTGDIRGPQIN